MNNAVLPSSCGFTACDHRRITRFERRPPIGNAAALLGIEEVERDCVDAKLRQGGREGRHERAVLPGTRAVREDERAIHPRLGRGVEKRRDLGVAC